MTEETDLQRLADLLVLGDVLNALAERYGGFDIVDHWTQGEFHHDLVVRLASDDLGGNVVVVATNCNGGVKELIVLENVPTQSALWHWRCPELEQFEGTLDDIRGVARTLHWFDPAQVFEEAIGEESATPRA